MWHSRLNTVLFCVLFVLISYSTAAQAEAQLAQANQHMVAKKYQAAAEIYEGLLAEGYSGAALHYNLGNAWYRAGNIGKAIINYERSLRLDPGNDLTQKNLKLAKEQLKDEVIELEPFFLYRWWMNLLGTLSATFWALLGILAVWGALYYGYRYLYGADRNERKKGFINGLTLVAIGLVFIFMASRKYLLEENSGAAIILAEEAVFCSAPNDPETAIQTLHMGTKVFLVDKIGEWQLVRLANGDRGWMNESTLEKI